MCGDLERNKMEENNELFKMFGSEFKSRTESNIEKLFTAQECNKKDLKDFADKVDRKLSSHLTKMTSIVVSVLVAGFGYYVLSVNSKNDAMLKQAQYNERIKAAADILLIEVQNGNKNFEKFAAEQNVRNDKQSILNEKIIIHIAKDKEK
jgi:hypothetical protein